MIEARKEELKSDDLRVRHRAEMSVKMFLKYLTEKGLAPNTQGAGLTTIRDFCKRIRACVIQYKSRAFREHLPLKNAHVPR
ncbi:MAG: hypothetical protein JSV57_02935 [Candidatus Bathyarchaeota archaeon]|nr:MAG: hypothetical protein JSV57_02935 [Candidatus Bathyarchaeota archaeon]